MNQFIIKKEFKESLYENKGIWMMVISACILSVLCLLVVNMKEGNSLAQCDILQYAIKACMFITLVISMVLGSSSFVSEREENTLESLLLTPISKLNLTLAKYFGVLIIGFVLYAVSIPYLIAIGAGSGLVLSAVLFTFLAGGILLIAFTSISIALSIVLKTSKASILTSTLLLIILTLPAFAKGLFKFSVVGKFFMQIDPMANCFNLMNSILIEKTSVLELGQYMLPLLVFVVIAVALLFAASSKVALKGEK